MINALSVLGWGVGGMREAEATMLGQPISMNIPDVVGFKLVGSLKEGITATDLVLSITKILREMVLSENLLNFLDGLSNLSLADRATISNMAPEYGATCGFFPTDQETIDYLKLTGKNEHHLNVVKLILKNK